MDDARLDALSTPEVRLARLETAMREHRQAHGREHQLIEAARSKAEDELRSLTTSQQNMFVTREGLAAGLAPLQQAHARFLGIVFAASAVAGIVGALGALVVQWIVSGRP